ncbi:MAG: 3-isopropylmalate dehydratase [Candidatus Lokiarchaeota archaeon]|nr:3-isopropylmalate dehydratase [Candidatus Lokiarchaeota archaeon]
MSKNENVKKGKVWVFGDNIDTDIIIPGRYLTIRDPEKMASHAFEPLNENFASQAEQGDIIIGGRNFGCGSSREEAPFVLKTLGIAAIIAESYARIFYRNAINLGIPLIEVKNISDKFKEGQVAEVDFTTGEVKNIDTNKTYKGTKLPDFLLEIIKMGGAIPAIKKKLNK